MVGRLTIAAFRVREIDPTLLEKVEVVDGDITEDNLGIDEQAERYAANLENTNFKINSFFKGF